MARFGVLTTICISLSLGFGPGQASANGRFPATTNTEFQPGNDQLIVLPTTFGLLLSGDDGANFKWICEDTVGYGGTYDPDYSVTTDGKIYATTFNGLRYSQDGGCTFEPTEFYNDLSGGNSPVLLEGHWVGEVEVATDGTIWATTSTGGQANDVYVSTDGLTFNSANNFHDIAWWKTLRVSKSNPDVVYVSGYVIEVDATPAQALLYKTVDGGQNWTDLGVSDFSFGVQPNLFIEGISPTDPNIVYARVLGARDPEGDDLYRSSDGGVSWTKVLEMGGVISAFAIRSDDSVLAGTATPCTEDLPTNSDASLPDKGCVRRSASGELGTWETPAVEPKLGCLGERASDGTLFGCAHNWDPDNFAFGNSNDNGDSWNKVMRFAEISGPLECPAETAQNNCEQLLWPSLCVMLGICEAPDAGPDGGNNVGPDAGAGDDGGGTGSCLGCQTSGSGSIPTLLLILGCYWLAFRRRKRASDSI